MTDVDLEFMANALRSYLPYGRRRTTKGWETMNCVACTHMGKTKDTKKKGAVIFSGSSFTYRCWRCDFKAHWRPGLLIGKKLTNLFEILGMPKDEIFKLSTQALQIRQLVDAGEIFAENIYETNEFVKVKLPDNAKNIFEIETKDKNYLKVLEYLTTRGEKVLESSDFYWSSSTKNNMNERIIVPFYFQNEIIGWTARYVGNKQNVPKYFSSQPPGYLFNNDYLFDNDRKYIILVEGPFDALAINGVAYLGETPTEQQINWINLCNKEIIVLPDRADSGKFAIETAIAHNWKVAFPFWEKEIKDANEAVLKYGALWTVNSIFKNLHEGEARIRQMSKFWLP